MNKITEIKIKKYISIINKISKTSIKVMQKPVTYLGDELEYRFVYEDPVKDGNDWWEMWYTEEELIKQLKLRIMILTYDNEQDYRNQNQKDITYT